MAKKDKDSRPNPAEFLTRMCEAAQVRTGKENVYIATDHEKQMFGLPMPYLCLQWLLCSNVFLLGRIYGVAGKPKSCKSAFLYEMMRWTTLYDGVAAVQETEAKTSYSLMRSVLDDALMQRVQYQKASTIDIAQSEITHILEHIKKEYPRRNLPALVGIDSLTGTVGDDQAAKIDKEGSADRGYPEAAIKYTPYFRFLSSKLTGWPINIVFTNHRKESIVESSPGRRKPDTTPGGDGQWFHASYYLWLDCISATKAADDSESRIIRIRTQKNSFGPDKKDLFVEFRWWWDENGVQRAKWDWDAATVYMLTQKWNEDGFPTKLKGVISIRAESGNLFTCKELGMQQVSASELGAAIHRDKQLMANLQRAIHIEQHKTFSDLTAMERPAVAVVRFAGH